MKNLLEAKLTFNKKHLGELKEKAQNLNLQIENLEKRIQKQERALENLQLKEDQKED